MSAGATVGHECEMCGGAADTAINDHWYCQRHFRTGATAIVAPVVQGLFRGRSMKLDVTENDIREIHRAVRDRAEALAKEATRLEGLSRYNEAQNLQATAQDLNERLCTYLASAVDENGKKGK